MTTTVPTLTDGTVRLRALAESDVQGCYEQCVDPASIRWTTVPVPFTPEDARVYCLDIAPTSWGDDSQWIFAVEVDGRYAGNIGLRNEGGGVAEVAFGSHPWVRGTGAMTRAVRLLLDWGFAARRIQTVVWRAHVGNWASRKVAWRLGFQHFEMLPAFLPQRGELRDSWVAVLRSTDPREPHGRWLTSPVLETDGLRLRPTTQTDVPRVVEACGDPRTQHWLGQLPAPYEERHVGVWFETTREKQATGVGTTWAIADRASDLLIGAISVFDLREGRQCEIGYWTHPEARGRDVMTRAVRTVVGYAFDGLDVGRVRAMAAVENTASRRVLEAAGMHQSGVERLGTNLRDGLADAAIYDVLADEWASARR